ncbi:MAG: hydroxyethylthiazole kinase [Candidatus Midichloria sp.]|nr:hydroxyethylthiazole kinase [Candidatus Midichloria sp.]
MANTLLAIGAAPIMSICEEELEELIKISSAVNLNIGTLDLDFIKRCESAAEIAKKYEKPVI